jgi:hypothetical protein
MRRNAYLFAVPCLILMPSACGGGEQEDTGALCRKVPTFASAHRGLIEEMEQLVAESKSDTYIMNDLQSMENLRKRQEARIEVMDGLLTEVDDLRQALNDVMPNSYAALLNEANGLTDLSTRTGEISAEVAARLNKDCQLAYDLVDAYTDSNCDLCPWPEAGD